MSTKRRILLTVVLLVIVLAGVGVWAMHEHANHHDGAVASAVDKVLYTCGMHPQIVREEPGNCPICGMKLTPIRKPAAPAERKIKYYKSTMNPGETSPTPGKDSMGMEMEPVYENQAAASESPVISIDPTTTQNMGIRIAPVTRGPLRRVIRTVGVVDYNETTLADVSTKFKGWIEKLNVNTTGELVMKGDPLFEIYSPELYSAQVEYLLATDPSNKAADNATVKAAALTKLKFFDISDQQIAELEKTRQPSKTVRINSPQDGFVIDKMVVEGQMVDAGMKIFRLGDLGLVWVQAQIYEQDLPYLQLGQEAMVTLSYLTDREFRGRVTYIYPSVDEKTRTAKVRLEFHNPGYFLKPGMFATVHITSELEPFALLVPDMAILRSGEKATVFVALGDGKFEPRNVTLGPQSEGDMYQVLAGVKDGERIVTSGQFMLDSESQLREAIAKMQKPNASGETQVASSQELLHAVTERSAPSTMPTTQTANVGPIKYICPMPEHVSIEYDHPGKCPICGMTLVPVTQATIRKLQPGGKVLYYTCPMPEHSDVRSDKPGKCPKCGMTLIPVMQAAPLPQTRPSQPDKATALYTCPMEAHAEVVSDKPGKCPKCGMQLVPTASVPHGKIAERIWNQQHRATTQPASL